MNNLERHRGHPKAIVKLPRTQSGPGQHYGEVRCRLCNQHVRWATKQEVHRLERKWHNTKELST